MTHGATKTVTYSNIVTAINRLMHLLFSLTLFLVLFLPWYPGMLAPHPYESPTPGWFLLLSTPFFGMLLFQIVSDVHLPLTLLLFLLGYLLPWGNLLLSLLNLLLAFFHSQTLVKVNFLILMSLFSATLVAFLSRIEGEKALSGFMVGFWTHLGLLFIIIVYEIVVFKTISQGT